MQNSKSTSNITLKSILVAGMLITGSVNTLTKKSQNDCVSKGIHKEHSFDHPWFQTAVMFAGEFVCLLAFALINITQNKMKRQVPSINIDDESALSSHFQKQRSWKDMLLFIFPTCLDVLGTSFGGIGLLWVSASVWQMMRGTIIIFSGILSAIFLKRKLLGYRWLGMFITALGLAVVGMSSFIEGGSASTHGSGKMVLGLGFIIAGQLFNAIQMIVEEKLLKDKEFPPLQVVGMEGFWGILLMSAIILPVMYFVPGSDNGSYENSLDALVQIKNNHVLLLMTIGYWISIAFYNFCGLAVTKELTAVHRTLIDATRTIVVWGVSLILYYTTPKHSYGEAWNKHSYIQVIGFLFLIVGTLVYNAVIRIPFLTYEQKPIILRNSQTENETQPLIKSSDE